MKDYSTLLTMNEDLVTELLFNDLLLAFDEQVQLEGVTDQVISKLVKPTSIVYKLASNPKREISKAKATFARINKELKIQDPKMYKVFAKNRAKLITNYKSILTKATTKNIPETISRLTAVSLDYLKSCARQLSERNVKRAFFLTMFVNSVNSALLYVLSSAFGPQVAVIALTCFLAPIVEELAKRYAIRHEFGTEFISIFSAFEFLANVIPGILVGIKAGKLILMRSIVVFLHIFTFLIQKILGKKHDKAALVLAIIVHAIYNIIQQVNQAEILIWLLK